MLVSPLDLVSLHRRRVNSINDVHEMVAIFLVGYDIKMPSKLVRVQVATNRHKLAGLVRIGGANQVCRVGLALLRKLLIDLIALSRSQTIVGGGPFFIHWNCVSTLPNFRTCLLFVSTCLSSGLILLSSGGGSGLLIRLLLGLFSMT